ncbi:MAG TPA: GspH/FimT family pseudopilin [Vicinamibacterales bacterium]|nr:GspH/FimT family pseudopilin [Vicinamibacterales bacterium]
MVRGLRRAGQSGVTLIELMMTLSVLGVLIAVAVPYLGDMVRNWRVSSQTNELIADLSSARGQAAGSGVTVTVCASSDGATCSTTWGTGRIMFTDADGSGAINGTDQIVRKSGALVEGTTLTVANLSTAGRLQFRPTGMAAGVTGGGATFKLCDQRSGDFGRLITVAATGRATSTTATCP